MLDSVEVHVGIHVPFLRPFITLDNLIYHLGELPGAGYLFQDEILGQAGGPKGDSVPRQGGRRSQRSVDLDRCAFLFPLH